MRNHSLSSLLVGALSFIISFSNTGFCSPRPVVPQEASAWQPTSDCSTCHTKYVQSMKDGSLLASTHAKAGLDQCTSCHDEQTLKQTHERVTAPPPILKVRRYPKEFCLKCHGSLEELAKKTESSKVLTDSKGHVINPHDLPKTPAHQKASECANCHRMHKKPMEPTEFCYGCHHKKEFACASCHANKK